MDIGIKIKKIRELKNFTQDYMAQQLNVSQSTYSRFEKDEGDLTLSQLKQIADLLEVKLEDLINFNDKFIFNNYGSNNQNYVVGENHITNGERELYERTFKLLEEKIQMLEEKLRNKASS